MPNYSLHNSVPEPDRSLADAGFNGMYHETDPQVSKEPGVPYNKPSPLENHVIESSNTQREDFPAPSGSFARRTS
jgi:hypothetical protein